jgi:hypothetical protein
VDGGGKKRKRKKVNKMLESFLGLTMLVIVSLLVSTTIKRKMK